MGGPMPDMDSGRWLMDQTAQKEHRVRKVS